MRDVRPSPGLQALWSSLGINPDWITARNLPLFADATALVTVAPGYPTQRVFQLTPEAATAWRAMNEAATADGIALLMISAWRGIDRQVELIRARLAEGEAITTVLERLAPPGCSEHHTGRAIDIATPGTITLDATFADTSAFAWLQQHAAAFGFVLSFPRDNPYGFTYEPWHWCYHPKNEA
ncbi:M15 family metallopeptidase [Silvimonas iriomotensis]|uniref:Peptidase n=1 Tax=Silvimonas iriomotensis TaxID=449662 RepID=A0ABQ2PBK9_9NEIS|nr:M15 family metallopeptidase [Silvimonas iriomotensis]GGP22895.1 peptidase [Silvimonas iriomotensis]